MTSQKCVNLGCNKYYDDSYSGPEMECKYHSGTPIFHEGLKGYSCCKKRVTDFDEFMNIEGCTIGTHSSVVKVTEQIVPEASPENNSEASEQSKATKSGCLMPGKSAENVPAPLSEEELWDDKDYSPKIGDICKRRGCRYVYKSEEKDGECFYHKGNPVFHEGSKGWSCCSRKVLEFEEFVKISGCCKHQRSHRFTEAGLSLIELRKDWYQTLNTVIIAFYAKNVDKDKSKIKIRESGVEMEIFYLNDPSSKSEISVDTFQFIDASLSNFRITPTKIELTLRKSNEISWPSLQVITDPTLIKTWTTFGISGKGTVGSKEAYIAKDVPIDALKGLNK